MAQRPDRTSQKSFELFDDSAIFEFHNHTHIQITISADSHWCFPLHWHTQNPNNCVKVTNVKGRLQVFYSTRRLPSGISMLPPGSSFNFKPEHHYGFSSNMDNHELVVLLEAEESQINLHRNICSVVTDAQLYPSLASTPCWIRILYQALSYSPQTQRHFIAKLLWIEIQMMRYTHDFYVVHGWINAPYLWWLAHPWEECREPQWTYDITWWSCAAISRVVQGICYWVGNLLLGMKGEYREYTPTRCMTEGEGLRGKQG